MSAPFDDDMLTRPITADCPCGENLEDTALLAAFDEFRLFGHSTPLDPAPDWAEVKKRALDALARSKDLRLLAHLATAVLRTDGLAAFSQALTVAAGWLDAYWTDTYPRLDEDAILRRNALNCLADGMAVIDGLRRLPLADSRQHGRFSLRDIDIATGVQAPDEGPRREEEQIDAAFAAMSIDELQRLEGSVSAAMAALKNIDTRMRQEAGPDAAPTFDPLLALLVRMQRVLRIRLAGRVADGAGGPAVAGSEAPPLAAAPAGAAPLPVGAVRSRDDATRALDAVSAFFRQHEPSSPVPLLLDRAKRLVSKDFLEVLADMAPDALAQARAAGGLKRE